VVLSHGEEGQEGCIIDECEDYEEERIVGVSSSHC